MTPPGVVGISAAPSFEAYGKFVTDDEQALFDRMASAVKAIADSHRDGVLAGYGTARTDLDGALSALVDVNGDDDYDELMNELVKTERKQKRSPMRRSAERRRAAR